MTKRSALAMAGGLIVAVLSAALAISLTIGAGSVASASHPMKPIVKRQVRTVTVHRSAKESGAAATRLVHLPSSSAASSSSESEFGSEFESDETGEGADFEDGGSSFVSLDGSSGSFGGDD